MYMINEWQDRKSYAQTVCRHGQVYGNSALYPDSHGPVSMFRIRIHIDFLDPNPIFF
jgi:hypothetical protein